MYCNVIAIFALCMFACMTHADTRALVIGIDGLKATELHRCMINGCAPHMKELAEQGTYAPCPTVHDGRCARAHDGSRLGSRYKWSTAPGWASVITGINTHQHKIKNNDHQNLLPFFEVTKKFPTMLKRAKHAGIDTVVSGVGAFITSFEDDEIYPGVVDYECAYNLNGPPVQPTTTSTCNATFRKALLSTSTTRDEELTEFIVDKITSSKAGLIMGVLDQVDGAGHDHGFDNNPHYLEAIYLADELVARLIAATRVTNDKWLYIITADHGGHRLLGGGAHDHIWYEDEVVPFIMATNTGAELAELKFPVRHMDVNPTVLTWLGLSPERGIDGRVQGLSTKYQTLMSSQTTCAVNTTESCQTPATKQ